MSFFKSSFVHAIVLMIIAIFIFKYGINPPIPQSLFLLYLAIALFGIFLFVSSSEASWDSFLRPWRATFYEEKFKWLRAILFIILPPLAAYLVHISTQVKIEPPPELRTIHPAPPTSINFGKDSINLQTANNPLREDKEKFQAHVAMGKEVYYKNCFYCHGDGLEGQGHFAEGLNPKPANFVDVGTIAQLRESYLFWRIAKGGPNLPTEATPWNSAMPAWEGYLKADEIWAVILYLYEATGHQPRKGEEEHH
jgi:mono/diheme cytochrome c family protein